MNVCLGQGPAWPDACRYCGSGGIALGYFSMRLAEIGAKARDRSHARRAGCDPLDWCRLPLSGGCRPCARPSRQRRKRGMVGQGPLCAAPLAGLLSNLNQSQSDPVCLAFVPAIRRSLRARGAGTVPDLWRGRCRVAVLSSTGPWASLPQGRRGGWLAICDWPVCGVDQRGDILGASPAAGLMQKG